VLKEPDFVIVYKGRVGVLEVDGAYHTGRAADDHKRDLFFEQSGIFVKHFNGDDVRSNVKLVVETFLKLLTGQTR
jgi:very-short-patch-repair endonuclease